MKVVKRGFLPIFLLTSFWSVILLSCFFILAESFVAKREIMLSFSKDSMCSTCILIAFVFGIASGIVNALAMMNVKKVINFEDRNVFSIDLVKSVQSMGFKQKAVSVADVLLFSSAKGMNILSGDILITFEGTRQLLRVRVHFLPDLFQSLTITGKSNKLLKNIA
jgi:hypothetical protein